MRKTVQPQVNAYNVDALFLYGMRMVEYDCCIHRQKLRRQEEFYLKTRNGRYLDQQSFDLRGPCTIPDAFVNYLHGTGLIAAIDEASAIFDLTEKGRAIFSLRRA